jgi:TRAP transporter 4TM/12TM fusion protein
MMDMPMKAAPWNRALDVLFLGGALAIVAYHVVEVFWSPGSAMEHYTTHLGMILAIVALQTAWIRCRSEVGARRVVWLVFAALMLMGTLIAVPYLYLEAESLELSQPFLTKAQFAHGLILLAVIFALNWVVWGAALTIVCLAATLYFGFGHLVPGLLADLQLEPEVIMSNLAGMGSPRGVFTYMPLSADTIFLLLVYGGLMSGTKVLDMFSELGKAIGNFFRGGVAFSCIAASSLIGMVTGQTVSCIALTGSMTIPTMNRGGFSREEAGAIEVLAANGSQIIPPIMGLGAFLMAVIIGMPYVEIAKAAILPSVLYMLTVGIGVFMLVQASPNIPFRRETVDWRKFCWIFPSFLPSIVLVITLLSLRYSANLAAFWGIVSIMALSVLRPKKFRPTLGDVLLGLRDGTVAAAQLGLILAAIGAIVQVLVTTGLGTELGRLMITLSGRNLEIALLLGMGIALVIGMGLPTPAAYSLCTIVMIPSLIDVGVEPLVAHFYGFYFAVFSAITPPVAVGILMAVRISGGSFAGTAIEALKLGGVCMLLPFFMVAFPNVLQFPNYTKETLAASLLLCVSTVMLSAAIYGALMGQLSRPERAFLFVALIPTFAYYEYRDGWIAWLTIVVFAGFLIYRKLKQRTLAAHSAG